MQQQPRELNRKDGFNFLVWITGAHCAAIIPFCRTKIGREGIGFSGLWALLLLVLVAGLAADPVMLGYLGCWLVALLIQRAITAGLVRRGWKEHSRYTGWPWLAALLVRKEAAAKQFGEPLLCITAAIVLWCVEEAYQPGLYVLAWFLFLGGFSLAFQYGLSEALQRRRVQDMLDARYEQEALIRQFREQGGDE